MSSPKHEIQDETEGRESGLLRRTFTSEISAGDGRTVDLVVVPFGEQATVADGLGGVPPGVAYQEEWMPGCFDKQISAANRILLNFEHEEGFRGIIGRGLELRSDGDGYHGSFRVSSGADGDKALELIRDEVLTSASVEVPVRTLKSVRSQSGVIQRVKAHLDKVALCRMGAYTRAVITAVRSEEALILDAELSVPAPDPETIARCRRLGIRLPDRYKTAAEIAEADELLQRSMVDTAWDGSASRWSTPAAYCAASAIDLNRPGAPKTKAACHLPFKEPDGDININGVRAALTRIGQGFPSDASQAQRDRARTMLEGILTRFNSQNGGQ